jgi:hypothetical protein
LLALWSSCADEEASATRSPDVVVVASSDAWHTDGAVDPFPEHLDGQPCGPGATLVEGEFLEVNTGICGYNVLTQATRTPIAAGATITSEVIHQSLFSPSAAEAHVALTLGGDVVWERAIPLPAELEVRAVLWTAPSDYPVGSPWVLHLHNHGSNAWLLGPVEMVPPPP